MTFLYNVNYSVNIIFVILGGGKKKTPHAHVTSAHVHPHGNGGTSAAPKATRRRLDRSPNKDKKKQDVVGTKQFWEEHNKVVVMLFNSAYNWI